MADPMTGPITRCPWCSAELAIPGAERCLACGATLVSPTGGPDPEIKGVTTLDTEAILRARSEVAHPRSRLLSFITGEAPPETGEPASPESLSPPPDAVRREMQRLELEAQRVDLEAETIALKADVLARRGFHASELGGDVPPAEPDAGESPGAEGSPGAPGVAGSPGA